MPISFSINFVKFKACAASDLEGYTAYGAASRAAPRSTPDSGKRVASRPAGAWPVGWSPFGRGMMFVEAAMARMVDENQGRRFRQAKGTRSATPGEKRVDATAPKRRMLSCRPKEASDGNLASGRCPCDAKQRHPRSRYDAPPYWCAAQPRQWQSMSRLPGLRGRSLPDRAS